MMFFLHTLPPKKTGHPLCNDPTGSGNIQGTRDSVAFYQSQVVGVVSF